jgi:hypothetical protein
VSLSLDIDAAASPAVAALNVVIAAPLIMLGTMGPFYSSPERLLATQALTRKATSKRLQRATFVQCLDATLCPPTRLLHPAGALPKEEELKVVHRNFVRIVTISGYATLVTLIGGCTAQSTGPQSSLADPAAAVASSQLGGTWRGELWPVGTDSTSALNSDVMLEIKDDATYRLTTTRRGTASNESGSVVQDGGAVILRSSTGQSTRLTRKGDSLHGVVTSAGRAMNIMVEKAR